MSANRLPAPYGRFLRRDKPITFTFEGMPYSGIAGDTIASALAANNQWLLSRSFKYHRPRAALTMAGQDANTLVSIPDGPNALADNVKIAEGLQVSAQNYSGSLERDRSAWLGLFARFLPVGFYYKAFFKPRGVWEKWAPLVRSKAGLGVIDQNFKPGYRDKQYAFYDLVVIGGGPAGMTAALAGAEMGAEVLLVEENPQLGGSLNYGRFALETAQSETRRTRLLAAVTSHANIEVMTDATCNGWFADNWLPVVRGQRLYKIRARQTLLCSGSLEQPAIFRNNDLPGVMMSSAAARLIHLYGVRPGTAAVVLAGNNDGYAVALDLIEAGIEVTAIVELRSRPDYDAVATRVLARGVTVKTGCAVFEARPGPGKKHLAGVEVRPLDADGACTGESEYFDCDLLCMAVGYMPTYQLACQAGGQLAYDDKTSMFSLSGLPGDLHLAGSVNGVWSLEAVCADAEHAAATACHALGLTDLPEAVATADNPHGSPNFPWPIFPHPRGMEFVDFDEDLQIADIVNATRDGYEHIQLVKRYSTCGMGPSQGRHSALATARLVADATDKTVAETGVTTARPPFAAEQLAHSAGRSYFPERRSSMHYRHIEAGAQMLQAGAWYRPAFYGSVGDRDKLIPQEVANVRTNVGLIDVSTLGGIEIRGPDAADFLNRIATFAFLKQPVGRARYMLLTNEAGVVIDDGVACRFQQDHFYVTATTGGVDRVYQSMLKWNAQWCMNIDIANVTTAWCGVNIAGPNARKVLQLLCEDVDLESAAFPYMGARQGTLAGIPARILRVGFVGELGYEIHAPQQYGEALWDAIMAAGKPFDIAPFGVEAQRLLRLEKGHIIIGQDTDAMSNPREVQMEWAVSTKKPFFVGGRTLQELNKAPAKRVLAGFVVRDPDAPIPLESQLVLEGDAMVGRVTSCNFSPTLGLPIGLAYLPPSQAREGASFTIKGPAGVRVRAEVVSTPFYDADNSRQAL